MKVTIAGKELKIYWRYCISEMTLKKIVSCYICDSSGECISEGWAACDRQDKFCKETGRKMSLTRAIKNYEMPHWDLPISDSLTKAERTQIWQAYFDRKPIPEVRSSDVKAGTRVYDPVHKEIYAALPLPKGCNYWRMIETDVHKAPDGMLVAITI